MLKVGVFGGSGAGKTHLQNWKQLERTELTGFYEPDDAVAEFTEKAFLIDRFSDVNFLIDTCDLIDITNPVDDCFAWCEKAIRKGKHVFIEKALANSIEEAKELVKLIKESNIKFQVGYGERFNPAFTGLLNIPVHPIYIESRNMLPIGTGGSAKSPLLDLMAPDVHIILTIAKSDVKSISATSASVISGNPDIINARIEFNNGCTANFTWGSLSVLPVHQMLLYEPGKFIDMDFIKKRTAIISDDDFHHSENIFARVVGETEKTQGDPDDDFSHNSVKQQLVEFRDAVLNNTTTIVSAMDGLRSMEIAHQILQKTRYSY
jgi:predicted dehydrogenase